MKCFYHSDKDAVGMCSQCGKACCRDCIEDIGGALLCKDCLTSAVEEAAEEHELERARAKRSITWSWIVTAVLGLVFAPIMIGAEDGAAGWGLAIFVVYAIWSTYWGLKVVWPWWKNLVSGIGCFILATPVICLLITALFFYIPFIGAYMYGVLGGGIYQYLKYRKIAMGEV